MIFPDSFIFLDIDAQPGTDVPDLFNHGEDIDFIEARQRLEEIINNERNSRISSLQEITYEKTEANPG